MKATPAHRPIFVQIRFTALLLFMASLPLQAQTVEDCISCHGDKSLQGTRNGRTVSRFVDEKKLRGSVHGKTSCVSCHKDLENGEFPHAEKLAKAVCGGCHTLEQRQHAASLHGRALSRGDPLAPDCETCHGSHDILPVKDPRSAVAPQQIPFVCGQCHQEGKPVQTQRAIHQSNILKNYEESIHGEGLMKKGLSVTATCASCHTAHQILPHTDVRSSIARRNIAATCSQCHRQIEEVHRKVIKGELWEREAHILPACVDCHQPHKVRKVYYDQGMSNKDCLRCHAEKGIRASKDGRSLYADTLQLSRSMHKGTACGQCHSGVSPSLHRPCETITKAVDCASCHAETGLLYLESKHGEFFLKDDPNAPTCKECHGTHAVLGKKDPASPTFPTNIPNLCGNCHRQGKKAAARITGTEKDIVGHYSESIHGKGLLKSGLTVTAMCTNCHTAHHELPHTDPRSSIHPANVPATCGSCHNGIQERFESSIHSAMANKSGKGLPACNDCHSAHTISRADGEGFKLTIMRQCGRCHEKIAETYFQTYHGKVSQLGYTKTAKCYDCHGAHDILPISDPRSHLSHKNVVQTCRKCHPGATRKFAGYLSHATHHDPDKYPFLFWAFWGMTGLLIGTFGASGLHTLLWLPRAFQMRRENKLKHLTHDPGAKQFRRFSRLNQIQHVLMILSFISLAFTGMALKFSYTSWAVLVAKGLGGFQNAGNIHRLAAAVMVGIFISHLIDLIRRMRRDYGGWQGMLLGSNTMLPTLRDVREVIATLKWFLGKGPRPGYGRWTYWEKFDYFAVFWGMFVIGGTGMTLWFPEFFTRFLPGWFLNVATIIHSDEALLATGFIFTVHFFNTHLRPEKFPMDTVIFTGRMPVEELKQDKPGEYEAMVQSGELEKRLVDPFPPMVTKAIRFFAWCALSFGFAMVLWIVYAMLFAYK